MNRNEAEVQLWAAFPSADEVVAQHLDGGKQMGLGIRYGEQMQGIRFNPARDDIHTVIEQLNQRLSPN